MAVPSAKNSGLERMSKRVPGLEFASKMVRIDSAVRHGTVDFSTTILDEVATAAMRRVADSTYLRSHALVSPAATRQRGKEVPKADVREICGKASTDTGLLGGSVDGDEDEVGFLDALVDVGGEKEVATPRLPYDLLQSGLIDRQLEDRKSTRLNSSHSGESRMPSSA